MSAVHTSDVVVVGNGIFGVTTAIALRERGATVTLLDAGSVPNPDAASTDISKLVRLDYGKDAGYVALMEDALVRWRQLNREWGAPLFHETGIAVLTTAPLTSGTFEGDSFELLRKRGHVLERLEGRVSERFPAWKEGAFVDGYFNPQGGFAESGRVVEALTARAERAGTKIVKGARVVPLAGDGPVSGVVTENGDRYSAETTVVAAGAYTPILLPELADRIVPIAQNVFHFAPKSAAAFTAPAFTPWAADIATTGWYGFSHHASVVKVANHGPGVTVDPAAPRLADEAALSEFRAFFERALPGLAKAKVVFSRRCLYSDSFDGDFFIDRHPTRSGLAIASGGSGHAFKFAPLLGELVADALERRISKQGERFRFRERGATKTEAARASIAAPTQITPSPAVPKKAASKKAPASKEPASTEPASTEPAAQAKPRRSPARSRS